MASLNKVTLIGHLGRDPELRSFPNGDQVANATIATTDKWKDKHTGEPREATEWHRITFTGRLAGIAGQYLRKGAQVYVEGALRTRKWTDAQGAEKYSTEVRAERLQMLGGGGAGREQGHGGQRQGQGRDGGGYLRGHQQAQAEQHSREQVPVREEFEDVPF